MILLNTVTVKKYNELTNLLSISKWNIIKNIF